MGARLRRGGKASFIGVIVVMAIVASAWLAYATTAPVTSSYPVTAAKVKAKGEIALCNTATKPKCSKFSMNVQRKATGKHAGELVGSYTVKDAVNKVNYSFTKKTFTGLTCVNGTSATLTAAGGKGSGKANKQKTFSTTATVTGSGTTGSLNTTITDDSNNAVVFTYNGPITNKAKISIVC
jgi:hypothetical protein